MRNVYRCLIKKCEGKRSLRTPKCCWEYNIKTDLKEREYECVNRIRFRIELSGGKQTSRSTRRGEFPDQMNDYLASQRRVSSMQ